MSTLVDLVNGSVVGADAAAAGEGAVDCLVHLFNSRQFGRLFVLRAVALQRGAAFGSVAELRASLSVAVLSVLEEEDEEVKGEEHDAEENLDNNEQPTTVSKKMRFLRDNTRLGAARATLNKHSLGDQTKSGLQALSERDFMRFQTLNAAYEAKHGFPFMLTIAGMTKDDILSTFERRLANDTELEMSNAIANVLSLMALRLTSAVEQHARDWELQQRKALSTVDATLRTSVVST